VEYTVYLRGVVRLVLRRDAVPRSPWALLDGAPSKSELTRSDKLWVGAVEVLERFGQLPCTETQARQYLVAHRGRNAHGHEANPTPRC
jgi:hypothetical protein